MQWNTSIGLLGLLFTGVARAESSVNLTQGVTRISQQVYGLHMTILYICTAIGALVFGAMFYAILKHRKSKGAVAANFHESTKVELLWTVIPFIILISMAVPATQTLIDMEDTSDADLTIKVTGSQWKWHYEYFGHGVEFLSLMSTPREQIQNQQTKGEHYLLEVDRPLVLPTDRKVRFLFTSDDVIHSWWIPAFSVKKDAIPGFINESWTHIDEPGTYRGQCTELCGKDHAFMPIVVEVKEAAEFDRWLTEQQQAARDALALEQQQMATLLGLEESMALGKEVYDSRCAACHQINGEGIPGVFPPMKAGPITTGPVADHIDIVVRGKAGSAMQAFGNQLSMKQLAAVITYERNAWGNNTGDVIQLTDIAPYLANK